tara:strand:+ start:1962 stop:4016 length:2055 start_codon:yes stop_codon:yes gene_type:complete
LKLYYSSEQKIVEWNEDYAKKEFLDYIFQDYSTSKRTDAEDIDEYIEEMIESQEGKLPVKEKFDEEEFRKICENAIKTLRNKKFSELGFNPRFKNETFKEVEPYISNKPILEATAKKAVQVATKDDVEFDKKKHIARAWGNNYSKYFDTVWEAKEKPKITETSKTVTKQFVISDHDPRLSKKEKGQTVQIEQREPLTKAKKLYDAGVTYFYKETAQPKSGSSSGFKSSLGDMIYSRTRASKRSFGLKTTDKKELNMDELSSDFVDKVVSERILEYENIKDSEGKGEGIKVAKTFEYDSGDSEYYLQRAMFFVDEMKDFLALSPEEQLKQMIFNSKKEFTAEEKEEMTEEVRREAKGMLSKLPSDFKQKGTAIKSALKKYDSMMEILEKLTELGNKGMKLSKTDIEKIDTDITSLLDTIKEEKKLYNIKSSGYRFKSDTGKNQQFNSLRFGFNQGSIAVLKKRGGIYYNLWQEGQTRRERTEKGKESKKKNPTKELTPTQLKEYKENQFERYNYLISHVLSWIAKELDVLVLAQMKILREAGKALDIEQDKESGTYYKQDLRAKEAFDDPKKWLKKEAKAALEDMLTLYEITLIVVETTPPEGKKKYSIKKWDITPRQQYLRGRIPLGTGTSVATGDTMRDTGDYRTTSAVSQEALPSELKKKVGYFSSLIRRRFKEIATSVREI